MKIALRARADGLLEPNSDRGVEWVQAQPPGAMITLEAPKDARSDAQNRFLWGWVYKNAVDLINDAGYMVGGPTGGIPWTKDTFHAAMRECFLIESSYICNAVGRELNIYRSTSKLTPKAFSNYIESIKQFCYGTFDISIPDPNEGYWLELFKELER